MTTKLISSNFLEGNCSKVHRSFSIFVVILIRTSFNVYNLPNNQLIKICNLVTSCQGLITSNSLLNLKPSFNKTIMVI